MVNLSVSGMFDTTNALASMFLGLMFGSLSVLLNCDLKRMIMRHPLVLHLVGVVAFFFLFTLIDESMDSGVLETWLKTLFLYALFMLLIKSKWYSVVPILALLLVDQTLKKDLAFKKSQNDPRYETRKALYTKLSRAFNIAIIVLAVAGTLHYAYLQKREYKGDFSVYKFFFGFTACKKS